MPLLFGYKLPTSYSIVTNLHKSAIHDPKLADRFLPSKKAYFYALSKPEFLKCRNSRSFP